MLSMRIGFSNVECPFGDFSHKIRTEKPQTMIADERLVPQPPGPPPPKKKPHPPSGTLTGDNPHLAMQSHTGSFQRVTRGSPLRSRLLLVSKVSPKTKLKPQSRHVGGNQFVNGPNTVSESTVSNTELSEFFWLSARSGERTQ